MTSKYFIAEHILDLPPISTLSVSSNKLLIPKETWSKPKPEIDILFSMYTMSFALTVVVTALCFVLLVLSEMSINRWLPYASIILPWGLSSLFPFSVKLARQMISITETQLTIIKVLPFPVPFLIVQSCSIKAHGTVIFLIPGYIPLMMQDGHRQHT